MTANEHMEQAMKDYQAHHHLSDTEMVEAREQGQAILNNAMVTPALESTLSQEEMEELNNL